MRMRLCPLYMLTISHCRTNEFAEQNRLGLDRCCFYDRGFLRNSLVALLEALCARNLFLSEHCRQHAHMYLVHCHFRNSPRERTSQEKRTVKKPQVSEAGTRSKDPWPPVQPALVPVLQLNLIVLHPHLILLVVWDRVASSAYVATNACWVWHWQTWKTSWDYLKGYTWTLNRRGCK